MNKKLWFAVTMGSHPMFHARAGGADHGGSASDKGRGLSATKPPGAPAPPTKKKGG